MKTLILAFILSMNLSYANDCEYNFIETRNYSNISHFEQKLMERKVKSIMRKFGYTLTQNKSDLTVSLGIMCDCNWEPGQNFPGNAVSIRLENNSLEMISAFEDHESPLFSAQIAFKKSLKQFKKELPVCK